MHRLRLLLPLLLLQLWLWLWLLQGYRLLKLLAPLLGQEAVRAGVA